VEVTNFLVVAPEKPWRSLPELIAAAKAKPGELSYGSSGVGGAQIGWYQVIATPQ